MKTRSIIILTLVLFFQLFCLLYWIPFSSLIKDTPLLNDDYPYHYSQIVSVINFAKEDGKMWGYNPFLLAGYPEPLFLGLDQMAWELFVYMLSPFLPLGVSFKLYVAIFLLIFPFLCYISGRNFGLGKLKCVIVLILGILIFYIPTIYEYKYPIVSGAAMVSYGMVSYVFLCYLSLYVLSIFYNFLENSRKRQIVLLFIFTPLLCLTHALAPLLLGIPILIMLLLYSDKLRKKYFLLTLLCIWTVAINSYWIIPLFKFLDYKESTAATNVWTSKDFYLPYQFYIKSFLSLDIFYSAVLIFGLMGLYFLYKEGRLKIGIPLLGQTVFLFCLCFYGGFSPFIENLHPYRFMLPLHLFLIFPCAVTIHRLLAKPILGISLILLFVFYLSTPVYAFLVKALFLEDYYLLKAEIPKRVKDLSGWVIKNTTPEARILLEDTKSQMHHPPPYFNSHFASLLPIYTKREFLVGPIPTPKENPYMTHTFSTFRQGELFWRELDTFSIAELRSYFDLYNINWIICWSKSSRNFFKRYPDYLKFTKKIDGFYIYKVFRSPSFFLKGEGDIVSEYNRLMLTNIKPRDNEIIIKYHWMKYLKTNPELKMERVMLLDDPVGFIKIKNPPSSLVIYNAY